MKISVIIASYNRSQNLVRFLGEIENQVVPVGSDWEVIIVDNNSTDGTREQVASFVDRDPRRFKYLHESRQGKSDSLNRGIRQATGDIFAFTDDDCIPNPDWLASILGEFNSDPSLDVVGGRVELYNNQDRPVSIRTCPDRTRISTYGQLFALLIGCNMAARRRVFESVQGFDPLLGPGKRTLALEDMDFLYRAYRRGFKMIYAPEILLYHNHGRRNDNEIESLSHAYVLGRGAFYCKHILKRDKDILKMAYWEVSSLSKGMIRELRAGDKLNGYSRLLWALFLGAGYRLASSLRYQKT
jgi:hypothetical protein